MRRRLALRGLGNLKEISIRRKGVRLVLENAALHLLVVGLVQGLYEQTWDTNSRVEWELSDEGDLEIEVYPLKAGSESVVFL
ncbi:MAG: hypothetical protein ACOC78_01140 [Actinomycetota bacterium]